MKKRSGYSIALALVLIAGLLTACGSDTVRTAVPLVATAENGNTAVPGVNGIPENSTESDMIISLQIGNPMITVKDIKQQIDENNMVPIIQNNRTLRLSRAGHIA